MDMQMVGDVLELGGKLVIPAAGLVVVLVGWKQSGRLDAKAAIGHASKLMHVVREHIDSDDEKQDAETGIAEVLDRVGSTDGRRSLVVAGARRLSKRVKAHVEAAVRDELSKEG